MFAWVALLAIHATSPWCWFDLLLLRTTTLLITFFLHIHRLQLSVLTALHTHSWTVSDLLALAFGGYKSPLGTRIKKGDSLEGVPQHTIATLSIPILSNPTGDMAGIQIQIPLTASEPQRKMSPNPRVLGPVKFAKAQEVELLWLETIKVRFSAANFNSVLSNFQIFDGLRIFLSLLSIFLYGTYLYYFM